VIALQDDSKVPLPEEERKESDLHNEGESGEEKYERRFAYFLGMLGSENAGQRWKAIEALARMEDPRAVEPLIRMLEDEDWRVRQKAAWALGYLGDPRAVVPLRRAYRDDREGVQEMILEAIDMITAKRRLPRYENE
jgi:HEAT repeat protein